MGRPPLPIGTHGSVSVTEVRKGVYRAKTRVRDPDGVTRQVTATARTAPAAERELKRVLAERVAPVDQGVTSNMRLAAAASAWLAYLERQGTREATTLDEYRRVVQNRILPTAGSLRLAEMTAGRCERLIQAQTTDSMRKKTKAVLGMLLDVAVLDGALLSNPVRATSRLRKAKPQDIRALSPEDLAAVRQAVHDWMTRKRPGPKSSPDLRDMVDLMLATGTRIGEILAVRWVDIDLGAEQPLLHVNGTIKTETGRGTYRKPTPKSVSSLRVVELPPFAVEILLRRRVEQPPNRYNAVFATRNGTWHQVGNMESRWRRIRTEVGLEWVTPHTFRRTVATMLDRLADTETAARQLGHGSSAITEAHYIERERTAPVTAHLIEAFAAPKRTLGE